MCAVLCRVCLSVHLNSGTPGPSINWGQELWTITDNFLVNAYGKYLSVSSSGGLSCVDSKSEAKVIPVGDEVLEGYVYKCGIFRGNNPIPLYFVLSQQGLSTYISKEAYLMVKKLVQSTISKLFSEPVDLGTSYSSGAKSAIQQY